MLQPQISLSKEIGQQEVGSKSHNNLQTMHKTIFEYAIFEYRIAIFDMQYSNIGLFLP